MEDQNTWLELMNKTHRIQGWSNISETLNDILTIILKQPWCKPQILGLKYFRSISFVADSTLNLIYNSSLIFIYKET